MVRELHVEEPEPTLEWDKEAEFYHDYVYGGIPMPDVLEEKLKEQFLFLNGEEAPSTTRAKREWDAYMVTQGELGEDERSPRERLSDYFSRT